MSWDPSFGIEHNDQLVQEMLSSILDEKSFISSNILSPNAKEFISKKHLKLVANQSKPPDTDGSNTLDFPPPSLKPEPSQFGSVSKSSDSVPAPKWLPNLTPLNIKDDAPWIVSDVLRLPNDPTPFPKPGTAWSNQVLDEKHMLPYSLLPDPTATPKWSTQDDGQGYPINMQPTDITPSINYTNMQTILDPAPPEIYDFIMPTTSFSNINYDNFHPTMLENVSNTSENVYSNNHSQYYNDFDQRFGTDARPPQNYYPFSAGNPNFCGFCKRNNEPRHVYESHALQVNGKKTCPMLKECYCANCGLRGHTMGYCSKKVKRGNSPSNSEPQPNQWNQWNNRSTRKP